MKQEDDYDEVMITRDEFERDFNVFPPGEATHVVMHSCYGFRSVKFIFAGKKQEEIQKLERLYKLQDLRRTGDHSQGDQ